MSSNHSSLSSIFHKTVRASRSRYIAIPILAAVSSAILAVLAGSTGSSVWKDILWGLLAGCVVAYLILAVLDFKEASNMLKEFFSHERIMYANKNATHCGYVVAVGQIGVVPPPVKLERKWDFSISVLRSDQPQDHFFSANYLEHFFSLKKNCHCPKRLLLANKPIHWEAYRAFLGLSRVVEVETYLLRNSESINLCKEVSAIIIEASDLAQIKNSNREKSLKSLTKKSLTKKSLAKDVLDRFASEANVEVFLRGPGEPKDFFNQYANCDEEGLKKWTWEFQYLDSKTGKVGTPKASSANPEEIHCFFWLFWLLDLGCKVQTRLYETGIGSLEAVSGDVNPWDPEVVWLAANELFKERSGA